MVEPVATPADVKGEIETRLDEESIRFQLDEAAFDNSRENDVAQMEDDVRKRIEQKLAALKILQGKDRQVRQKAVGSASKAYDGDAIERLRRELRQLDPSGDLIEDPDETGRYEVF